MSAIGGVFSAIGGIEPSPTRERRVSGKNLERNLAGEFTYERLVDFRTHRNIVIRHVPHHIAKNQKIHLDSNERLTVSETTHATSSHS
jgi:hypothetical protein